MDIDVLHKTEPAYKRALFLGEYVSVSTLIHVICYTWKG